MKLAANISAALSACLLAGCGLLVPEIEPCAGDDGCPSGFVCSESSGLCQPKPKLDAAQSDAGPQRDAGAPDSSACPCKLEELCYQIGEHNPDNACVWCQPIGTGNGWTAINNAYVCSGTDRVQCTAGTGTVVPGCWACDELTGECCGGDSQPCCDEAPACATFLRCQADLCAPACGLLDEPCCTGGACGETGLLCYDLYQGAGLRCYPCGDQSQPCCVNGETKYCNGLTCCVNGGLGYCESDGVTCT